MTDSSTLPPLCPKSALLQKIIWFYPLGVLAMFWEGFAHSGFISPVLFAPIELVLVEWWKFAVKGDLFFHGSATLYRAFTGFGMAIVTGVIIGTLIARVQFFAKFLEPIFIFGYPIPKISLYPIFIFIFGFDDASKIVLVFLECLYPITIQTMFGMRNADKILIWSARNSGASSARTFWLVLTPCAAPSIFTGIRIALPISLIVTIITEMIGESRGLGYLVVFGSSSFEPAQAMAAFMTIAIIGFTLDRTLGLLRRKILYWQPDVKIIN